MNKDEIIKAQAMDKIRQCCDKNFITNTTFLDIHAQSLLRRMTDQSKFDCEIRFFGGHEEAERVVMICVPQYMELETADIFKLIRVTGRNDGKPLSHGDFLGSLLGLGIKREMTGDIIVRENGADIIVLEEIAEYIASNYLKVGRQSISSEIAGIEELIVSQSKKQIFPASISSLRLDNVVSSGFRISRSKAVEGIKARNVYVNHIEISDPDFKLKEGDLIGFRKKGRIRLSEIRGKTKKDRFSVTFEK